MRKKSSLLINLEGFHTVLHVRIEARVVPHWLLHLPITFSKKESASCIRERGGKFSYGSLDLPVTNLFPPWSSDTFYACLSLVIRFPPVNILDKFEGDWEKQIDADHVKILFPDRDSVWGFHWTAEDDNTGKFLDTTQRRPQWEVRNAIWNSCFLIYSTLFSYRSEVVTHQHILLGFVSGNYSRDHLWTWGTGSPNEWGPEGSPTVWCCDDPPFWPYPAGCW